MSYRVALVEWDQDGGGIGEAVFDELAALGHRPTIFPARAYSNFILSGEVDVVMLFGPFDKFTEILRYIAEMPLLERPTTLFWNTEGFPDLKTPWALMKHFALARSWVGRQVEVSSSIAKLPGARDLLRQIDERMIRYRNLGDFLYVRNQGWLDIYGDISAVYAHFLRRRADFDPVAAPFGSFHKWHESLGLERDIDVMWMGKRASKRRSDLLDRLRSDLRKQGVDMLIFDNEERPFVFGEERLKVLNRSKVNINLLRTWYDENSLRFCMAAPNRSMIASEPLLPHVPKYEAGVHYVSAPIESLAEQIVYYLKNEDARSQIVENAYNLMMNELTFRNSMKQLMERVAQVRGDEPATDTYAIHT